MLFQRYLGRKAPSFEDASDGQPYLGVGGRGAGCQTYTYGTFGEPATLLYLFATVQRRVCRFVADGVAVYAVAACYVIAARDPLLSDDRQVVRVRGVVTSDHDHHIERILE